MSFPTIEIPWTELQYIAGGIAATIAALGTAAGISRKARTYMWKPITRRIQARRERFELLPTIVASLGRIEGELKTNGGHSVKDMVIQMDKNLAYLEARTRHQDQTSEIPIFELGPDGAMRFANGVLCEVLKADEKDLLHRNYISRVSSHDKPRLLQELGDAIANKMPLDTIVYFQVSPIQKVKIHLKAVPTVRGAGDIIGYFGRAEVVS